MTCSDLPDWTDISTYPDTKIFSPTQWAWEFLRRTADYRKDWSTFYSGIESNLSGLSLIESYLLQYEKQGGIARAASAALKDLAPMFSLSDLLIMSDTDKEKRNQFMQSHYEQYIKLDDIRRKSLYAANKWLLVDMLDPTKSINTNVEFNIAVVKSETGCERVQRNALEHFLLSMHQVECDINMDGLILDDASLNQAHQLHLTIDMRMPIGTIKQHVIAEVERRFAEAKLTDLDSIDIRDRSDKYLLYLRALDAIQNDVSKDEIGMVLFARQYDGDIAAMRKQVDNTIMSAKKAQANYWKIACLNKP